MGLSKTAVNASDETLARSIWRLHGEGETPAAIAKRLGVVRDVVRDSLNGRRLAFPMSERSACPKRRCPYCGKSVLSLPCLACEIDGTAARSQQSKPVVKAKPKVSQQGDATDFTLKSGVSQKARGRMPKTRRLDSESMTRLEKHLVCDKCGERRIRTTSGRVCPNGHGKIHPALDPLDVRSYEHTLRLRTLPKATISNSNRRVVDVEGYSKQFEKAKTDDDGTIEVAVGDNVWVVKPYWEKTRA